MTEVRITYETLYELLRREKERNDLQELSPSFFADVADYLKEKIKRLNEHQNKQDLFSASERDKISQQINNVKRILSDLYNRRQNKMISMAVNKSILETTSIDLTGMLDSEKQFYEEVLEVFSRHRKSVLYKLLQADPDIDVPRPEPQDVPHDDRQSSSPQPAAEDPQSSIMLRFVKPVPKFLGLDKELFGPFEEEDIASLPPDFASVLVSKGKAEKIDQKNS